MAKYLYWATSLTGGGEGALDKIDGADLGDLDGAIAITPSITYIYALDADSGLAESPPDIIAPDTNPGDKRWILVRVALSELTIDADKNWAGKNITNLGAGTHDVNARLAEVITARGSMASLDARLDVSLNEDGTVKSYWVAANETWTYASATTFTISGNKTDKYQKGDKIKLTQTTVKYFYVIGASYVDPNTTVTVTGGSDYSLADAAITANYYSKADNPQGFPQWFNWAPTYTGFAAANPTTYYARFRINGKTCTLAIYAIGTSNATGFTFTAPINAAYASLDSPIAVEDNGSWQNTVGVVRVQTNGTADVGITLSTMSAAAYAGFTASGTKGIIGYYSYQI